MSVPSWARVGAKVVCVEDCCFNWDDHPPHGPAPEVGDISTIAEIAVDADGVWLVLREHSDLDSFGIEAFRPLVSTKTEAEDVALFRDLLKTEHREDA